MPNTGNGLYDSKMQFAGGWQLSTPIYNWTIIFFFRDMRRKINFKCSQKEWNLWLNKIPFHKLFYHALENWRWFSHKTSFIWRTACILLELKCYSDVFLYCDGDEHDKYLKVDPLHPNISIHILYTLLYIFLLVLTRRIC